MIAADDEYLKPLLRQTEKKLIEQLHRFRRGHRPVINISGDNNALRPFLQGDLQNFFQYIFLVFHHGKFVDPFSQMQVRQMNQLQRLLLSAAGLPFPLQPGRFLPGS